MSNFKSPRKVGLSFNSTEEMDKIWYNVNWNIKATVDHWKFWLMAEMEYGEGIKQGNGSTKQKFFYPAAYDR